MANLTYRNIGPDDVDAMHSIASHWTVVRQLGGWPWPADRAFTETRCKPYKGKGFVWAICLDDKLVGSIGGRGDLGYMLHPSVHGQGIATRAAKAAISHAFDDIGYDRLRAATWYDNPQSGRVLAKCGFTHWQTRYERSKARGYPVITHHYRLTRATWERLRTASQ